MRAAVVQINSTEAVDRNLAVADRLTRDAAAAGAKLVVLPEKFNLLGSEDAMRAGAEPIDGPAMTWASATARDLGIDLVAGSFAERRGGRDRASNTCVHFGPGGETKAVYRKIHMFDVTVGDIEYRESATEEPGSEIVTSTLADDTRLGLAVCYDLRFPELFRTLAIDGARIVALPSAFTRTTGEAHWDILVRARAIEDQVFMVAADQVGSHAQGLESFGGSMIVDPWGRVLDRVDEGTEGMALAELDLSEQASIRERLPSLANRMPEAYGPQEEASRAQPPTGAATPAESLGR